MKTKNFFIIMVLGIVLMSSLSGCVTYKIDGNPRVGVDGQVRVNQTNSLGMLKFNMWNQFQPPIWDDFSKEYYHLDYGYTLQRTSATTWQVWSRNNGRLQPFGDPIPDFNIYQALDRSGYMKGTSLKVTYFHPTFYDLRLCYELVVNGDRFIINSNGYIYRAQPYAVLDAPTQKYFLPEGKWVDNQD